MAREFAGKKARRKNEKRNGRKNRVKRGKIEKKDDWKSVIENRQFFPHFPMSAEYTEFQFRQ